MKIKKIDILYFLALYLTLIRLLINSTTIMEISPFVQNVMQVTIIVLLIIRCLYIKMTFKEVIIKFFIAIVFFISYRFSGESAILLSYFLIIAAKDIDIDIIVKSILVPLAIFLFFCIFLYFLDSIFDIESLNLMTRTIDGENVKRYTFFFKHPNCFAEYLCWTIFMILYIRFKKINITTWIYVIGIAAFLYVFPNSRTNCLILLMAIPIYYLYIKFNSKFIKFIQCNIYNICLILSLIFIILYGKNNLVNFVDKLLSSRIYCAYITNKVFGVSILGQKLPIGGNVVITQYEWIKKYALDNCYYRIIYSYGLCTTIIYTLFINKLIRFLVQKKYKRELFFVTLLCIFNISEIVGVQAIIAFPLFFINEMFNDKEKEDKNGKSIYNNTGI